MYAAKAQIDSALTEIMPELQGLAHNQKDIAQNVGIFIEALDDLKFSTNNCVNDMELQRKEMYAVSKKMIQLRDGVKSQNDS